MNRFTVSQFASRLYGQKPTYGFRIFDHRSGTPVLIATFPTESLAKSVADILNTHTN